VETVRQSLFSPDNLYFVGVDNPALAAWDTSGSESSISIVRRMFTLCLQVLACRPWSLLKFSHSYPGLLFLVDQRHRVLNSCSQHLQLQLVMLPEGCSCICSLL
jgi:hypothetical protein